MPKWNQWSNEVTRERETVRAYGVEKVMNSCREGDSYKAQALRQLAMRLELESELKEYQKEIARLTNEIESLRA